MYNMKKLICSTIFSFCFMITSFAQVNQSDVQQMLKDLGTSMSKIETLYIGNVKVFYKDGSYKKTYAKYTKNNAGTTTTFTLTSSGVSMKSTASGKVTGITLIPYASIIKINIQSNYIGIDLAE